MTTRISLTLALVLAALLICTASMAQTENDARKIMDEHKDAVVTVDIVLNAKMTYEGKTESQEEKHTAAATVVDPSGLAVTSLTQVSPDSYMDPSDKASGYDYQIDIKDVRIRTADGTEIPADIVLRDRDRDLAFIRPKTKPDQPLPYIDLTASSAPQVLDQIVILSRLGQSANRSASAKLMRVESVVTKPRTFYVIGAGMGNQLGVPAFTLDDKCVGVLVIRCTGSISSSADMTDAYVTVIPCSTLATAAAQAKEAKPVSKPATGTATPAPTAKPKP